MQTIHTGTPTGCNFCYLAGRKWAGNILPATSQPDIIWFQAEASAAYDLSTLSTTAANKERHRKDFIAGAVDKLNESKQTSEYGTVL